MISALVGAIGLSSCDVNEKQSAETAASRIAVGDSLVLSLPALPVSVAATNLEFAADSGKTYTIAWSDPGASIAVGVVSVSGDAPYVESSLETAGFEKAVEFPATKSGGYRAVVSGAPGAVFSVGLRSRDGLAPSVAAPDIYEYDDLRQGAALLKNDGSWQYHSFTTSGHPDVDWIRIDVDSGNIYSVVREDSLVAGVSAGLFSADSVALGVERYVAVRKASIYCRVAPPSGKGGFYRIKLVIVKGLPSGYVAPDSYENDNTMLTAGQLPLDSSWQSHSLHPVGPVGKHQTDIDLIRIQADSGRTYRIYFVPSDTNYYAAIARVLGSDSLPVLVRSSTYRFFTTILVPCNRTGPIFVEVTARSQPTSYRIAAIAVDSLPEWAIPPRTEAGHTLATATPVGSDSASSFVGRLFGNDTNWLVLRLKPGRIYTLAPATLSSGALWQNIDATIFDSLGNRISTIAANQSWTYFAKTGDSRFLRIAPSAKNNTESILYKVDVASFEPPLDPNEPDNSMNTASVLATDGKHVARWTAPDDPDWMVFQVDSGRRVTINLRGAVVGRLYSRDSVYVAAIWGGEAFATGYLDYTPGHSGPMYLNIEPATGYKPYSVWIDEHGADTAGQCGSIADACPVEADSVSVLRSSFASSSMYFFKLHVTAGRTYRIESKNNYSGSVYVVDAQGNYKGVTSAINQSEAYKAYYPASADGDIYVRASVSYWAYNDPPASFRLWVSVVRDEAGEPGNNGLAQAMDLAVDGAGSTGVLTKGDVDFLKFHADSGCVYAFTASADDSLRLDLLSPDSVIVAKTQAASGVATKLRYMVDRTGTWYARLTTRSASQEAKWNLSAVEYAPGTGRVDTSRANAVELPNNGDASVHRIVGGDMDWYWVSVDSGVTYSVSVNSNERLDVVPYTVDWLELKNGGFSHPGFDVPVVDFKLSHAGKVFLAVITTNGRIDPKTPFEYTLHVDRSNEVAP